MLLRHQHLASGRSLWSLMRYGGRTKTFRRIRNCSRLEQALFYSPKPGEAPATAERFSSTEVTVHRRRFLGSLASSLLASNRRMAVAAASARPSTGKRFTVWTSPPSAGTD